MITEKRRKRRTVKEVVYRVLVSFTFYARVARSLDLERMLDTMGFKSFFENVLD